MKNLYYKLNNKDIFNYIGVVIGSQSASFYLQL